jgi:hypothetical protein
MLGLHGLISTVRTKIFLFSDRIEVVGLTGHRSLERSEILGIRSLRTSPPGVVLIPRNPGWRSLKFYLTFPLDTEFVQWVYSLPSLEAHDRRASKSEIRNNPRLGATPGERMKALARARKRAVVFNVASVAICAWGLYPQPYTLSILSIALVPWIALARVISSKGLFSLLDSKPNDVHPSVGLGFIFSILILALRATDFETIPSINLLWITLVAGALLCASAYLADQTLRRKPGNLAVLALFCIVYGFGLTVEANALLDSSPGVLYTARVQNCRPHTGRSTRYTVQLEPWGPKTTPNQMRISRETYEYIRPGNKVNLRLYKGALHIAWYQMLSWER